ncbi:adenylyltransferase/cytidyltransferase family protein [Mangrovimonas sp. AS39]|uniref:adenylyltransferase/cytidyltransferase family protein n=1 Tax=Mangrovimonas futianensis TaxID=2895523 RepID=UPI001E2A62CA|nr:adenylyltransferase/cytidyltransferase family protein [Mangrovimonas futianensis]MCF1192839.1 adenylyltransferase/cytidyltransferase family protein [Mangrovimonas futianensis]MCF1196559.1 adenylyltransferase/cytidyltransferase family protein [Mangrovimonas futianensis]
MAKKVFVSGCFDMLHSGHIAFFKEAASYGDLYVGIGSDATVLELKGRHTINSEQERMYVIDAIKHVKKVFVNKGSGILDFDEDLKDLQPDIFVVNEDGYSPAKKELCDSLGIDFKVLKRIPDAGLPERSTTAIRTEGNCTLPYRIDLAGTWIDQPYVSKFHPGWALTISLEPTIEYNERCGMSTSTRNAAKNIWPYYLPLEKPEKLAEILFKFENDPGSSIISGAQDAIGICMPGLVRHYYDNDYWPKKFESIHSESILSWLEDHLCMTLLWPREKGLDLLSDTHINETNVMALAQAADQVWDAILAQDLDRFAQGFLNSFKAQTKMFPNMLNDRIEQEIAKYKDQALAWKLAGAGGGGYLIMVSKEPIPGTMRIHIRRKDSHL